MSGLNTVASAPPTMQGRLEHLSHVCRRLSDLEARMRLTANEIRCTPEDPNKDLARPEAPDLVGRFGAALDFASEKLARIEDWCERIESALGVKGANSAASPCAPEQPARAYR